MAAVLARARAGRHWLKKASAQRHWSQSARGRNRRGASARPSQRRICMGAPGLAQGSGWLMEICPPFAKLVSRPAAPRRSSTFTSWPARARYQAVVTPVRPAPRTVTCIGWEGLNNGETEGRSTAGSRRGWDAMLKQGEEFAEMQNHTSGRPCTWAACRESGIITHLFPLYRTGSLLHASRHFDPIPHRTTARRPHGCRPAASHGGGGAGGQGHRSERVQGRTGWGAGGGGYG